MVIYTKLSGRPSGMGMWKINVGLKLIDQIVCPLNLHPTLPGNLVNKHIKLPAPSSFFSANLTFPLSSHIEMFILAKVANFLACVFLFKPNKNLRPVIQFSHSPRIRYNCSFAASINTPEDLRRQIEGGRLGDHLVYLLISAHTVFTPSS